MSLQIIVKGKTEEMARMKGRGIAELGRNLEQEGWPSEFATEGQYDRIRSLERRLGRRLRKTDIGIIR